MIHWEKMVFVFRNAIMSRPKRCMSSRTVYFRKEEVHLLSQTYRSIFVSVLLQLALFGMGNCKLMEAKEVIYMSIRRYSSCIFHHMIGCSKY